MLAKWQAFLLPVYFFAFVRDKIKKVRMAKKETPALFGIKNSNRDFSQVDSWGKNCFNSSFPVALGCYMHSKNIKPVYLYTNKSLAVIHKNIDVRDLYGGDPLKDNLFFSFETQYKPYLDYVSSNLEGDDVVIRRGGKDIRCLEVKLTALPDNSTCDLTEDKYSCELVVRPATIIYLACSICELYKHKKRELKLILNKFTTIKDWNNPSEILELLIDMKNAINIIMKNNIDAQIPLIIEPVWKTKGKSNVLADECLDLFVWSSFSLIRLFSSRKIESKVSRQDRTLVWLIKMLLDYSTYGKFNFKEIIDSITLNVKNDKAFSSNGRETYPFLKCKELTKPRVKKDEIKNIVLGGGQNLLSPERRFDAFVSFNEDLFL